MLSDRLAGAFLLILGGLLLLIIIPWQVETVDYGWLRPRTMPSLLAGLLALCGLLLVLRPGTQPPRSANWPRAALYAGLLIAGLALISRYGFLWVAPPLALALMWLAGERRWIWLAAGTMGTPAMIWLCVAILLERPLP